MPIFMDRHDIPGATAEDVADAHKEDLKIQDQYDCRALTYWFDEEKGMAFCLIEAPDKEAVQRLHDYAHGLIPNQVIEVEPEVVRSFLGRIEDPDEGANPGTDVIKDPAFRSIMAVSIDEVHKVSSNGSADWHSDFASQFKAFVEKYQGSEVEHPGDYFMASFASVNQSVLCAQALQGKYKGSLPGPEQAFRIGLSAGVPVNDDEVFFGKTINLARHLAMIARPGGILLSPLVGELSGSRVNGSQHKNEGLASMLNPREETFLHQVMEVIDHQVNDPAFDVEAFGKCLGMSKSQLYRKLRSLTGHSPNDFIKECRLKNAFRLINQKRGNISEIAFSAGFSSLSYFSKCFLERFDILPSEYAKTLAS